MDLQLSESFVPIISKEKKEKEGRRASVGRRGGLEEPEWRVAEGFRISGERISERPEGFWESVLLRGCKGLKSESSRPQKVFSEIDRRG